MRWFWWTVILSAVWFCCGGCVAYQIRDELRATNLKLTHISGQLDRVSTDLAQTNAKLDKANHSLRVMENSMDPIRVSLRRIDDELAGFREMIDKLDKYLPINIKPETPQPVKQAPTQETTPQKR